MTEENNSPYRSFVNQHPKFEKSDPPKEWYYFIPLREGKKVIGLILGLHKLAHEIICNEFKSDNQSVASVSEEYGIPELSYPFENETWGYGHVFKTVPINENWFEYHIPFTGDSRSISLTLANVFQSLAWDFNSETSEQIEQVALIDRMILRSGFHGAGFSSVVSPHVRKWVENITEKDVKRICNTMFQAFTRLWPSYKTRQYEFRMWVSNDRFGMSVPGDCACIGVEGGTDRDEGICYRLDPHNVDHVNQQLALLTGVAEIWFSARNWYLETTLA